MKHDVRVFADVNELSLRAAEAVVRTINESVQTNGRFSLVLSGGNTPRTLYRLLSSQFRDQIPWAKVHVFWTPTDHFMEGEVAILSRSRR
jgi:6-phosphogluconolactonase